MPEASEEKYIENNLCSSKAYIRQFNACSMSDVYNIVSYIGEDVFMFKEDIFGRPIWFRGLDIEEHTLIPTLFRSRDNTGNSSGFYSTLSLAEEYRYQNFTARVNHLVATNPKSRPEWQELLQHHLGKTRFMDWSESLETAIIFALEPFIDTKETEDNHIRRSLSTPCVWVMNPFGLNKHVYEFFADESNTTDSLDLIIKALRNLYYDKDVARVGKNIQLELRNNKELYFGIDKNIGEDIVINGITSICGLDNYYHYNASNIKRMLENYEFNPFFYLLVRYYADALPVKAGTDNVLLPPLASVQPYHSERIRAQRGTFTIFPNYCRTENAKALSGTKLDVIPLEAQKMIADCFCKIRLCDPAEIAKELVYAGKRRPEIYPDVERYVDYLETQKFY